MSGRDNWDDLRFALAVARSGSVSAAARVLGVNHATVLRRVASFEDRHGTALFEKSQRGYEVPDDRRRIVAALAEVENAAVSVERLMRGTTAPLRGVVRVTSTDTFCLAVLPPVVSALRNALPGLTVELTCSNAHLDMSRLQADIAVRPTPKLPDDLSGTMAGELAFDVYGAPGGDDARWLELAAPLARSLPARWMAEHVAPAAIAGGADSFVVLREMAAAGQGLAILPCILGDGDARLVRHRDVIPPMTVPVWVACHSDLSNAPRIRAVHDALVEGLGARKADLAGRAG
ncbi:MAG: LysR family transcriptional regulator [Paracoccaceae bacterium]